MQTVEKWRVLELAEVLNFLADLLKKGDNPEWANVFFHFYQETQKVIYKKDFDLDELKRLMQNIINCFNGLSSFKNLVLLHQDSDESPKLNHEFNQTKILLLKIMSEIKRQTTEYIN